MLVRALWITLGMRLATCKCGRRARLVALPWRKPALTAQGFGSTALGAGDVRAPPASPLSSPVTRALPSMSIAAQIVTGLVALLHLYFLVLEMFLWTHAAGRKAFGMTPEQAQATKVLAANQGLYNGFLAAGLCWSLLLGPAGAAIRLFFLSCVLVAGLYGGITASRKIVLVQALPALIALALSLAS